MPRNLRTNPRWGDLGELLRRSSRDRLELRDRLEALDLSDEERALLRDLLDRRGL